MCNNRLLKKYIKNTKLAATRGEIENSRKRKDCTLYSNVRELRVRSSVCRWNSKGG